MRREVKRQASFIRVVDADSSHMIGEVYSVRDSNEESYTELWFVNDVLTDVDVDKGGVFAAIRYILSHLGESLEAI